MTPEGKRGRPLASLSRKRSTLATVRLKAQMVNPWSPTFRMRFWPITARPIRPISALGTIRASPPTLMPARRALQSAQNSDQNNSTVENKGYNVSILALKERRWSSRWIRDELGEIFAGGGAGRDGGSRTTHTALSAIVMVMKGIF